MRSSQRKGAIHLVLLFLLFVIGLAVVLGVQNKRGTVAGVSDGIIRICVFNNRILDPIFSRIWDTRNCNLITYQGDTAIVGLDRPISSRTQLEGIERIFAKRSLIGFPENLFFKKPLTQTDGQAVQDVRLKNFRPIGGRVRLGIPDIWPGNPRQRGTDYPRTWEFIISAEAKAKLDANKAKLGGDAITVLRKHADAASEIWANSLPSIHRKAILTRITIVDSNVLSAAKGGWRVVNDHNFGWWPNDTLNGAPGFIPFDIDSRWALDENWPDLISNNGNLFQGVKVDYGLVHELTHHMPVGDEYVYNFGSGRGFEIPQSGNKTAYFVWNALSFMANDHMDSPGSTKLTAPTSYFINFYWAKNPKQIRNSQDNPYPVTEVYAHFFYDPLNIEITGLDQAGVTGCNYLRQIPPPPDSNPLPLYVSADRLSVNFANGKCTLSLNRDQQIAAFPGGYIGLQKSGVTFPVYIPRVLMETLYWQNPSSPVPASYTFTLNNTARLKGALDFYVTKVNAGTGRVNLNPSSMWAYMDVLPVANLPPNTVLYGSIDQLNNQYIIEYRYP